ncbi:hypothetical protein [Egicoccus sp. AB-alg2]|uniref:hypothetical protein n=1 Tax=Egicoccus sp. AB-alg2 TaxID=3242693 RepID=UPI00359E0D11
MCNGVGGALAWGVQPVVAGGAQAVLHEMVSFVVEGAGWLLEQVASFLDTSTRPQLTSSWFERAYQDMAVVAVFGLLPFLLLAIVQGVVRQDPGMLLRATFGYVPLAAIGTAAGVVVVDLLVQLTDELTAWVGRSLGSDLAGFSTGMGESLASLPAGMGGPVAGLAALLAAGVVAFAAFAIWLELLLRQAAIYVAVLFLPLGFMAMVWPATAHWLRRLVQGLVAIILSKFVIVAAMALAAVALGEPASEVAADGDSGGFGVVLAGASMLALAALAPYVLLRLIPVFEAGLSGDLEGTYRRPTAAVASPTAGHHVLQSVRAHAGTSRANGHGVPGAGGHAGAAAGAVTPETGGASTRPGTGSTGSGSTGPGAGSPAAGSGAGGAPAGRTVSSGAAVGTGVVAAGVGTVAAGAAGAKKAGQALQAHGDEQHAAVGGVRSADGAGTAHSAPAPAPSSPRRTLGPAGSTSPRSEPTPRRQSREEG